MTNDEKGLTAYYYRVFLVFVCLLSGSGAVAQTCVQPPPGLVGWWPADGNARDIWSANDGALQNGATYASGTNSEAFSLDGIDDLVLVPSNPSLNFGAGQNFSIEAWINLQSPAPGHDNEIAVKIKHAPSGFSGGFAFRVSRDTNRLMFQITPDGFATYYMFSNTSIPTNVWTHVAAVREGASGLLYIDGMLDAAATLSDVSLTNSWPLSIGGLYDERFSPPVQQDNVFGGLIDEVKIFNRALTALEIQAIYEAGSAGNCKFRLPFVGLYEIGQGPCPGHIGLLGGRSEAIDYSLPAFCVTAEGTTVLATHDGTVVYVSEYDGGAICDPSRNPCHSVSFSESGTPQCTTNPVKGLGLYVQIRHDDGTLSTYAHLSSVEPGVAAGVDVSRGDPIGEAGCSDKKKKRRRIGNHLHFELHDPACKPLDITELPGTQFVGCQAGPDGTAEGPPR